MKNQIEKLKKEKNAVILAHYYAPAEVQGIADYLSWPDQYGELQPDLLELLPDR